MLEIGDIHKSFGNLEVLKGVSMNAGKGDVVSIIGASGSGKSTFLRCINLLEMPTQGSIKLDGEELDRIAAHGDRVQIAAPGSVVALEASAAAATLTLDDGRTLSAPLVIAADRTGSRHKACHASSWWR